MFFYHHYAEYYSQAQSQALNYIDLVLLNFIFSLEKF
jgi:hypothetical protein